MPEPIIAREPTLTVRPRPVPWFLRRRFLRSFVPVASLGLACVVAMTLSATVLLPFERLVTLEGAMGSKADYFNDPEVQELLLRHHIRVHVTRLGSHDAATGNLDVLDFVFPSGAPASELVKQRRREKGEYNSMHRPFVSPIVLATYRGYAETLRDAGAATPQATTGLDRPYFYDLDMGRFLDLVRAQKSWDDLNIRTYGVTNGNKVQVQTTSVCSSNSGATYLGLVSFVIHGTVPTTEEEAVDFAEKTKPLLSQGLPVNAPTELYFVPEGRQTVPVVVFYEHQYLAGQLRHRERSGELDVDRVLLYPSPVFLTEPQFVALNADADRLGRLLETDPALQRRALELGFRVLDPTAVSSSEQLSRFLAERGVPVPSRPGDTKAELPEGRLLEKMIDVAGGCLPSVPH